MSVRTARLTIAVLLAYGMASTAQAQTSQALGIGAKFSMPVAPYRESWPSFDYFSVKPAPFSSLNGDIRYRMAPESIEGFFVGGGRNRANRFGDSGGGLDLFAAFEFLSGRVHRFGELRFTANDEYSARASVGLNVMLGSS